MHHQSFPFRKIGDFLVTALSDGTMSASLDLLSGISTEDAEVIQRSAGVVKTSDIHINCYLIQGCGRTILVDSGTGGLNNMAGQLKGNLFAVGVKPDEVDTLLLTHAHPDHIGGLLEAQGEPVYKHARVFLHPLEAQYWQDDGRLNAASEHGLRNVMLVRRTLDAYAHNVHFFDGSEIIKDILPVWLPGHTPGHSGFHIASANECLLIWGDIVHFPHIQSAHPAVSIAFDHDPAQAQETRKKCLEQAVRENLLIAGMHLGKAGFANILMSNGGYRISYLRSTGNAVRS